MTYPEQARLVHVRGEIRREVTQSLTKCILGTQRQSPVLYKLSFPRITSRFGEYTSSRAHTLGLARTERLPSAHTTRFSIILVWETPAPRASWIAPGECPFPAQPRIHVQPHPIAIVIDINSATRQYGRGDKRAIITRPPPGDSMWEYVPRTLKSSTYVIPTSRNRSGQSESGSSGNRDERAIPQRTLLQSHTSA